MSDTRTILTTGANSGFGRAVAEEALTREWNVFATARDQSKLSAPDGKANYRFDSAELDVTNKAQIHEAVAAVVDLFGRIDVLHNNAGYGLMGGIEELDEDRVRHQMDVNFFGALAVMKAVLKPMRERKSGHILNMSSIAGLIGARGYGVYAASKFALEAVSEAVADEAGPLRIKVTLVEPSGFRTDFHGRSLKTGTDTIADYAETAGTATQGQRDLDGRQSGDPVRAAQAMLDVTEMSDPPLRLPLGNAAVDRARDKITILARDVDRTETVARGTDFPN